MVTEKLLKAFVAYLVCSSISIGAITASVITLDAGGSGYFVMPDGNTKLDDTAVLQFGVFNQSAFDALSPSQKVQLPFVSGTFTEYGSVNFNALGEIFNPAVSGDGGTAGEKLSVFVFQGNDFGIFSSTNSAWDYPDESAEFPVPANLTASLIDVSYSGLGTIIAGDPLKFQLITGVPEPAESAIILGLIGFLIITQKRRLSRV